MAMNKHRYLIYILLLVILASCQSQSGNDSSQNSAKYSLLIDSALIPTDSTQFYFPLDVFKDTSIFVRRDTFVDSWYSKHLFAMKEPILFADKSQSETYRFTWLRTFHNPIAIRIEKRGNSYMLYWKLCDGAGGYQPGQLIIDQRKEIDKATWNEFQNGLAQIDFWNMQTNETEISGTDGARWILEGKKDQQYQVLDRWSPSEKSKYYQVCYFLIGLTDLVIKEDEKY